MENQPFGEMLPKMVVEPPGPKSRELAERIRRVESPAASGIKAGEIPIFWERSRGANIVDADGNLYIDTTSGFAAAVAGHSNPRIVAAIQKQSEQLLHSMGVSHPNIPRVELAEKLAKVAPGDLSISHIASTGSEAVEIALKLARLYTGKNTIIAFQGGYHGRTFGALTVTSQKSAREAWQPIITHTLHAPYAYCYRCPLGQKYPDCELACAKYLEHILTFPGSGVADVAAVIAEPVLGMGGFVIPPPGFLKKVVEICHKHGILFIADEIITGFGRTGKWFGTQHSDIVPDILVLGKGIASGYPVSATVTTPQIADRWKSKQHTSTFLGHPAGCAAALASIQEIQERNLVQRSAELGAELKTALLAMQGRHPLMGDVRGLGLMVAVELVKDKATRQPAPEETTRVADACGRRGVLATFRGGSYNNCIRFSPPLVITREQLQFVVNTLDESLSEVEAAL